MSAQTYKDIARLLTEQRARHLKTSPKSTPVPAPAVAPKAVKKTTRKPAAISAFWRKWRNTSKTGSNAGATPTFCPFPSPRTC